jgi:hypothetical protein
MSCSANSFFSSRFSSSVLSSLEGPSIDTPTSFPQVDAAGGMVRNFAAALYDLSNRKPVDGPFDEIHLVLR